MAGHENAVTCIIAERRMWQELMWTWDVQRNFLSRYSSFCLSLSWIFVVLVIPNFGSDQKCLNDSFCVGKLPPFGHTNYFLFKKCFEGHGRKDKQKTCEKIQIKFCWLWTYMSKCLCNDMFTFKRCAQAVTKAKLPQFSCTGSYLFCFGVYLCSWFHFCHG